jgi:signal peptidase I
MLGDNRGRSADSRFFGLVPREALIGRAGRILVSVAYQEDWSPRLERFNLSMDED